MPEEDLYLQDKRLLALALLLKDQLNVLRALHGLPEITNAQARAAYIAKLNELSYSCRPKPVVPEGEE